MTWVFWLLLLLAIIAIPAFTAVVKKSTPDAVWNWYSTLFSTLSFVLAMLAGFWLYSAQTHQMDDQQRERLRAVLVSELQEIESVLDLHGSFKLYLPSDTLSVVVTYVQPLAVEEAARSGLFDSTMTSRLLRFARRVHFYNVEVQHLLSSMRSTGLTDIRAIKGVVGSIQNTRQKILAGVEVLSRDLE